MDRIALFGALFFSLLLATSGSMSSASVAARKGYNPRLGALFGGIAGLVGGLGPAYGWLLADQKGSLAVLISIVGSLATLIVLWRFLPDRDSNAGALPLGAALKRNIVGRHTRGAIMRTLFIVSIAVALLALAILLATIINKSVGLVAVQYAVPPEALAVSAYDTGHYLGEVPPDEIPALLAAHVRQVRLQELVLAQVAGADADEWDALKAQSVSVVLGADAVYDAALAAVPVGELTSQQAIDILVNNLAAADLQILVYTEAGRTLSSHGDAISVLSDAELVAVMTESIHAERLQTLILLDVMSIPANEAVPSDTTVQQTLNDSINYPADLALKPFNSLTAAESAAILVRNLPRADVEEIYVLNGDHPSLEDVSENALGAIIAENVRKARLRVIMLDRLAGITRSDLESMSADAKQALSAQPLSELLKKKDVPASLVDRTYGQLTEAELADLMVRNLRRGDLEEILYDNVVQEQVVEGWTLWESWTKRDEIDEIQRTKLKQAVIQWRSWVNQDFLNNTISYTRPDETGVRAGLRGTLLIIFITILIAFPVGVGAAIYLEEYAGDVHFRSPLLNALVGFVNRVIQTNISNLAGVPSIIYGILGLAIFVRSLEVLTSGNVFGLNNPNGRTVLSAGFTLALLILPLIIINAQEAIRAVPDSLRQASYGLGATKWQTIWHHVLPYAMPGVLTGTILAISRAIGETAPLILVGGATFLLQDPAGPFSQFTALPLLIYRWTTLPQSEFRNAAAAAIIVLLILLLTLNSIAVVLRNRFTRRLS